MHYYKFDIAAYKNDTDHLTLIEHAIYRKLIDLYYSEENPLGYEWVSRRLKLGSQEEFLALNNVLADFFFLENDLYCHKKIDEDIQKYRVNSDKNRLNGKKGGRHKAPPEPIETQWVPSGGPELTQVAGQFKNLRIYKFNNLNNPKEKNTKKEIIQPNLSDGSQNSIFVDDKNHIDLQAKGLSVKNQMATKSKSVNAVKPTDVDEQVWNDWVSHRLKKKAAASETAIAGARSVANEVGMSLNELLVAWVTSGWTGIKADWIRKDEGLSKSGSVTKRVMSNLTNGLSDSKGISFFDKEKNTSHSRFISKPNQ